MKIDVTMLLLVLTERWVQLLHSEGGDSLQSTSRTLLSLKSPPSQVLLQRSIPFTQSVLSPPLFTAPTFLVMTVILGTVASA